MNVPAVAVVLEHDFSDASLASLAQVLAASDHVRFEAVWGPSSERLHDLVDQAALLRREFGPITTWENDCTIEDFLWQFAVPDRGLLDVEFQDQGNLLCHVSDSESLPANLIAAVESVRNGTIEPSDD